MRGNRIMWLRFHDLSPKFTVEDLVFNLFLALLTPPWKNKQNLSTNNTNVYLLLVCYHLNILIFLWLIFYHLTANVCRTSLCESLLILLETKEQCLHVNESTSCLGFTIWRPNSSHPVSLEIRELWLWTWSLGF